MKLMHNFVVHSNESACRKSGRLGLEQVYSIINNIGTYGILNLENPPGINLHKLFSNLFAL